MKVVKVVRELVKEQVYNFHCLPSETYVSEGIVVHNCYKANTPDQTISYMNLDTYMKLFDKINIPTLTQIAFGITSINANPDFFKIMSYTKEKGIAPNYTTNGMNVTAEIAKKTKELCGAVAVSVYPHTKKIAYDAIRKYTEAGMTQVNIHFMFSAENMGFLKEVLSDIENGESRLAGLNAIVLLQYKDKNPKSKHHSPSYEDFKYVVNRCLQNKTRFGFDSCSSAMFMKTVALLPEAKELIQSVDNCESSCMSFYINYEGIGFPCSFLEGVNDWEQGLDILNIKDFVKDIWYNDKVVAFRNNLLESSKACVCEFSGSCRSCFVYDINKCKA